MQAVGRGSRVERALGARLRRMIAGLAAAASVFGVQVAAAAEYYVSPSGDDASAGDAERPFRTIGQCAAVAMAGDTCHIGGGEYHEMVTPAHSGTDGAPISFVQLDPASPVIVSGTRPITGWTPHSGSIWKASVDFSFDQLFADKKRLLIARTPNNASGDEYHPTFFHATADGGTSSLVDDVDLTQPDDYWKGAKIYVVPGLAWSADQGDITGSSASDHRVDFSPAIGFGAFYSVDATSRYFLYDKLELLDAPSEWYLDAGTGTVYVWMPQGDDPNAHVLEAPDGSPAGFDLSGKSFIHLSGLTIRSGDLQMPDSTHCRVENSWHLFPAGELDVGGSDNEIVHSEIAYASGRCVNLGGTRNAVRASHIHHCDYLGKYADIVTLAGPENIVADSSLHDTGRDGVGTHGSTDGSILEHNEIFNAGLIAKDCGAFYTYEADGGGTVLRYNVVHDVWPAITEQYGVVLGMGIYFDDGCSNYSAHHNVIYRIATAGLFLHQPSKNIPVYNNTVIASGGGWGDALGSAPGNEGPDTTGSVVANNLAVLLDDRDGYCIGLSGDVPAYDHNGYFQMSGQGRLNSAGVEPTGVTGDPLFTNVAGDDYTLTQGSPMIDKGRAILGITDGFAGDAPDIGAYEHGGAEQPGPREPPGPPVMSTPDGGAPDAGAPDAGGLPDDGEPDAGTGDGPSSPGSRGCACSVGERPTGVDSLAWLPATALLCMRGRRKRNRP